MHHFPHYAPHLPVLYHWVRQLVWANGHTVCRWVRVPAFRL